MVPFACMIISNTLLIKYVLSSRVRMGKSVKQPVQGRRDRRMAFSVVALNMIFLVLNTPIVIEVLFEASGPTNPFFHFISYLMYYMYYAIGFYTLTTVNREFRNEFYKILKRCLHISNADSDVVVKGKEATNKNIVKNVVSSHTPNIYFKI